MKDIYVSQKSNEWETPKWLFYCFNKEYNFNLDAAANEGNALCHNYLTEEQNSLVHKWEGNVWCNPPYGRSIGKFVKKAYEESKNGSLIVLLIPARTDTQWWHNYCSKGEVIFIKGRLKFINKTFPSWREDGNFKISPAPFPSAIVIFGTKNNSTTYMTQNELRQTI